MGGEWYPIICEIPQPPHYRYHALGVAMARAADMLRDHLRFALDALSD